MSATCRTRKRKPSSSRRSAQAGTAQCGCGRAGRASRPVPARRARTRSRLRSGSVRAADELLPSTDPHSPRATGFARRSYSRREVGVRTRESHHGPRSGPDFLAEWPREESNLRARIRSPSLYPLSYGAVRSSVAASTANLRAERVADGTRTHDPAARSRAFGARLRAGGPLRPSPLIPSEWKRGRAEPDLAWRLPEVADGTRTHDHLDHNQGLYQLSYSHRARKE